MPGDATAFLGPLAIHRKGKEYSQVDYSHAAVTPRRGASTKLHFMLYSLHPARVSMAALMCIT